MTDFSIIIARCNSVEALQATICSIQAKTCGDWEVICVDDGLTDTALEMLHHEAAKDPRIRVVQKIGKDISCARNFAALIYSGGDVLLVYDACDIREPQKPSHMAAYFQDSNIAADLRAVLRSRKAALRIPAWFGHIPSRHSEAVFLRQPSPKALQLGPKHMLPLTLVVQGLLRSPTGFFSPTNQCFGTLIKAFWVRILPDRVCHALFAL